MIRIIRTKPSTYQELSLERSLRPFINAGLVHSLTEAEELSFIKDVILDHPSTGYHFDHVFNTDGKPMTPSEIYEHLHARDDVIPPFIHTEYQNGQYSNIDRLTGPALSELLAYAVSRKLVKPIRAVATKPKRSKGVKKNGK